MADLDPFIAATLLTLAVLAVALACGFGLCWVSDKVRGRRDRTENLRWIDDYDRAQRRQSLRAAQYNPKEFRRR